MRSGDVRAAVGGVLAAAVWLLLLHLVLLAGWVITLVVQQQWRGRSAPDSVAVP